MSSNVLGRKVAKKALKYEGASTGSKKHKEIIKIFNTVKPDGYTANGKEFWCAIFYTAILTSMGFSQDEVPMSANVPNIVSKAKKMGLWSKSPRVGNGIVYDWNVNGTGDHIGFVYKIDDDYVYTIEGNAGNLGTCKRRKILKTDRTIMGYVAPKYNAIYIDYIARRYAWAKGTEKSKYKVKGGKPNKFFRRAWKKHFPKEKIGSGCHQYVRLVMRVCGYKKMPLSWDKIIKYLKERCTQVAFKGNTNSLRKGDIFIYRRLDGNVKKYHIFVIVEFGGKLMIAEANQNRYYAHINSSLKKTVKSYDKVWLFRPKER